MRTTYSTLSAVALSAIIIAFGVRSERALFAATASVEGTELPPATQIVDPLGATWTLAPDQRVLRNGVQAAGGTGSRIYTTQGDIYVYGGDSRWWKWTGSGWIVYGSLKPTSAAGTQVPPANQIVDTGGNTWGLASDFRVLRNGAQAAGGYSSRILWLNQTIYVLGMDGVWWYQWTGSGWTPYGTTAPGGSGTQTTSPSGTQVPPATQIVDGGGAVWTLASDKRVLRNGAQAAGGYANSILWLNNTLYVLGLDGVWWYQWTGSGWAAYGTTSPDGSGGGSGGGGGSVPSVSGDFYVSPGEDIQSVLNGAAQGQTIVLRAGVHRMQTLQPKTGQIIAGEQGAVLSGARLLGSFSWTGSYWMIAGQSQQGPVVGLPDACSTTAPRCAYPEDLFIDDRVLTPVGSLAEVTTGKWFFDYANDRIYMSDNPTGHRVETSVTAAAFTGFGQNVTVRGLIVEKFATPTAQAAFNSMNAGWIIEDCEVRWNHFAGIRTADWTIARRNNVHHNGAFGFMGSSYGATVDTNEIAWNNTLGYNAYWGAGGAKFVDTSHLTLRNNFVHHNDGPGLHTDLNNIYLLVESNRVEDNNLSGIFHEVGYQATIRYNTISRNGRSRPWPGWVDGAGILVSASPDVEVYGNTLTDNWQGIAGLGWNRGAGTYGDYVLKNLNVHDNAVYQTAPQPSGAARTGIIDKDGTGAPFSAASNNKYVHNSYWLGTNPYYFMWNGGDVNENTWRSYGQDTSGTFTR